MPITQLPPAPSRAQPADFSNKGDAMFAALPQFVTEANALETNVNAKEAIASQAATDSQSAKIEAMAYAAAAAAAASATKWIGGTNYAEGICTWSPSNYKTYRRKSPGGVSNVDPANDAVGWEPLVVVIFVDTDAIIKGSDDPTKRVRFEVDGISTGTTRVITVPNEDLTLAGRGANKFSSQQTAPGFVSGTVVNAAATGAITLDLSLGDTFDLTLTGNVTSCTFTNVPALAANEELPVVIRVRQGATAFSFAYPTTAAWLTSGGTAPATPAANKVLELLYSKLGANGWTGRKGSGT